MTMAWASWLAFSAVLMNFLVALSATTGIAWFSKNSRLYRFPETRSSSILALLGQAHAWGTVMSSGIVWGWTKCAKWAFLVEILGFCLWCDFCMLRAFLRYNRTSSFVKNHIVHSLSMSIVALFNTGVLFMWFFSYPPCSFAYLIFSTAWMCAFFAFTAVVWHRCEYGIDHPTISERLASRNVAIAFFSTIAPALFLRVSIPEATWVAHVYSAATAIFHIVSNCVVFYPTLFVQPEEKIMALLDTNQKVRTPAELLASSKYAEKFTTWAGTQEDIVDDDGNTYAPENYVACYYQLRSYKLKVRETRGDLEDDSRWIGMDVNRDDYISSQTTDLQSMASLVLGTHVSAGGTNAIVLTEKERQKVRALAEQPWPQIEEFPELLDVKILDFFERALWNRFVDFAKNNLDGDDFELKAFGAAARSGNYKALEDPTARKGTNLKKRKKKKRGRRRNAKGRPSAQELIDDGEKDPTSTSTSTSNESESEEDDVVYATLSQFSDGQDLERGGGGKGEDFS